MKCVDHRLPCVYCGTEIDEEGYEENYIRHYVEVCLERVKAALRECERENARLRERSSYSVCTKCSRVTTNE